MKKILFIILAVCMTASIHAQIYNGYPDYRYEGAQREVSKRDTNANATTTYVSYTAIGSRVKAFQESVTKISGTVGGTVILQGTIDGNNWVDIDTLTLTNVAAQPKVISISKTMYHSYQAKFTTTGTQASYLVFSYLRRQDE